MVSDERALLVVLDLVAAERKSGRVALPVTTTRVAEQVCQSHGVQVEWTATSPDVLAEAAAADDVILAADGRGGFIVPEFCPVHRRHRRLHPAARPGGADPAHAQPDRREDPPGALAQGVAAHAVGGQGQRDAGGRRGGRRPPAGHDRRRARGRGGPRLGARAARSGGARSPTCGPRAPTTTPPSRCWTSGRRSWSGPAADPAGSAACPADPARLHSGRVLRHVRESSFIGERQPSEVSLMWQRRRGTAAAGVQRAEMPPGDGARRGRSGRLAWRMDRHATTRVTLTPSPEFMPRTSHVGLGSEPTAWPMNGRPGEVMQSVHCSQCGRPNPEGARFCAHCGSPLPRRGRRGAAGGVHVHDLARRLGIYRGRSRR